MEQIVGTTILPDGRRVVLVKGYYTCNGCIFHHESYGCTKMDDCAEDGRGIIYKEIKEE